MPAHVVLDDGKTDASQIDRAFSNCIMIEEIEKNDFSFSGDVGGEVLGAIHIVPWVRTRYPE
jgi:hypothetical protein